VQLLQQQEEEYRRSFIVQLSWQFSDVLVSCMLVAGRKAARVELSCNCPAVFMK
jgi:hypothetical protein